MPPIPTVKLARPLAAVSVLDAAGQFVAAGDGADGLEGQVTPEQLAAAMDAARRQKLQELESRKTELAQLCETVGRIAGKLDTLHQETVARNRSEIARLAVEIARKILIYKTSEGDYDIQAIVEEALKRAPTRQAITVRVNPEDLARCQQLRQEGPDSPFAELDFVADWSIARADCLVETPKGIVQSFVLEHLERISEALTKVE